jgi:outer membrane receptor protein involved in Fe transport
VISATIRALMLVAALLAGEADETTTAKPAVFRDEAVVTATRFEAAADRLPVEVTVLGREQIASAAGHTVDDVLRRIPSFQLLREQSSEVSPNVKTSVAFRGLTGTSASRALVLLDGVPLNDPFQGYVRWSQVPQDSIERVEVVRGGSVVWGNLAIGGTIHLITRHADPDQSRFHLEAGERSRQATTLSYGRTLGTATRMRLQGSYQESDGYFRLPAGARTPVDTRIASDTATAAATFDFSPADRHELRAHGNWFDDDRGLQLVTETERTDAWSLGFGGSSVGSGGGAWSWHLLANRVVASQYAVRANRSRTDVIPNRDQYDVPADSLAADAQWSRVFGRHELAIGGDSRFTRGEVDELADWDGARFTIDRRSGGDQTLSGLYAQDLLPLGDRVTLYGALRLDRWESAGGFRDALAAASGERLDETRFGTRSGSVASPSVGVTVRVGGRALARIAAYGGFRAPTLNELYKPVLGLNGTIESNPAAEPEKLRGIETGWQLLPRRGVDLAVGVFHTEVDGLIQNVTVGEAGETPRVIEPCGLIPAGLSCRQRQNVGRMRSEGLELSASWSTVGGLRLFGSATFQDAAIVSAPEQPQLVGKRVQQAADWVANVGVGAPFAGRGSFTLAYRRVSDRYDDDLEEDYVGELASLDLNVGWRLREGLDATLKVVNVLDRENPVGVTGGRSEVGPPRLFAVAVRWSP